MFDLSFCFYLSIICPELHNAINSRPIINEDQSRIFLLSLSLPIAIENFSFRLFLSIEWKSRTRKKKKKKKTTTSKSDNGSLSHIVLCDEYFILQRKQTERQKFQSSLPLFSDEECRFSLTISNHWMRCRQRKSHNIYPNKMK